MRALASYILRGPVQATSSAVVPAILSVYAPQVFTVLFVYFTGAVIALVALRLGLRKGSLPAVAAMLAVLVMLQLLPLDVASRVDGWHSLVIWGLVWISAGVMRFTASLAITLYLVAAVQILAVVLFYAFTDSPQQFWLQVLEAVRPYLEAQTIGLSSDQVNELLTRTALIATGSIAAYTGLGVLLSLLLGRAWQAMLYNPGGLRKEFQQLRLGRGVGSMTLLLLAVLILMPATATKLVGLLINVSIVLGFVYLVTGLAVVHGLFARRKDAVFWLVGLYALLILLGQVVAPALMLLALTDIWLDYRNRWRNPADG